MKPSGKSMIELHLEHHVDPDTSDFLNRARRLQTGIIGRLPDYLVRTDRDDVEPKPPTRRRTVKPPHPPPGPSKNR